MCGRQLEALASAKAGEAAAAYYSASVTRTRVGKTGFLSLCKLYFSQPIKCISITSSTAFVSMSAKTEDWGVFVYVRLLMTKMWRRKMMTKRLFEEVSDDEPDENDHLDCVLTLVNFWCDSRLRRREMFLWPARLPGDSVHTPSPASTVFVCSMYLCISVFLVPVIVWCSCYVPGIGVSRMFYVNLDSPNLGFPFFYFCRKGGAGKKIILYLEMICTVH